MASGNGKKEFIASSLSYQPSLIPQMKEFHISVPFAHKMPTRHDEYKDDPLYLRYFANVNLDVPLTSAQIASIRKFASEAAVNKASQQRMELERAMQKERNLRTEAMIKYMESKPNANPQRFNEWYENGGKESMSEQGKIIETSDTGTATVLETLTQLDVQLESIGKRIQKIEDKRAINS